MKSLRNGFFTIFLLFFIPLFAFAADDAKEFENPSACGISSNNTVEMYSMSVCEQDIGFRIFYKLFPDIYNDFIFPALQPKYLEKIKDIEADNINVYVGYEIMLVNIIAVIANAAYYLAFLFIAWYAFLGIVKTMQDGTFLGEDWHPGKTAIKYGVLAILILPVGKGLILGQIFLLVLVIFSIAIANMLLSVFLSYMQVGTESPDLSNTDTTEQNDKDKSADDDSYSHNRFYANEYARNMVKIATCQVQSQNYYFESVIPQLNSSNLEEFKRCNFLKGSSANYSTGIAGNGFVTEPSFIHYENSDNSYNNGSGPISIVSKILFEKQTQNNSQCTSVVGNYDYKCGSIQVANPNITNSDILSLMKTANVYQVYTAVSNSIKGNFDKNSIQSAVYSGWEQILPVLETQLTNNGKKSLTSTDEQYIKTISYFYHQMLLNTALVGSSSVQNNSFLSDAYYDSTNYVLANAVAKYVVSINCSDNKELLKKGENLLNNISNISELKDRQYSSACTSGAVNILGKESDKTGLSTKIYEVSKKISDNVYNQRTGIETSLYKSFLNLPSNSIYSYIRKKGFASMGGYMFKLMKEKEFDNKIKNTFRNSIQFDTSNMGNNFIKVETLSESTGTASPSLNANFRDITHIFELVNASLENTRDDLRNVDISQYTMSFVNAKANEATKNESEIDRILDFMASPFASFKLAIGLKGDQAIGSNILSECVQNVTNCPVPIENPMVSLSNFGHQLIDVGAAFVGTGILLDYISFKSEYFSKKPSISEGKKLKDLDSGLEKFKLGASSTGKFIGSAATTIGLNLAKTIIEALAPLGVLMIFGGITIAYIIPLIPFISYQISILSWVVITLLSIFILPIWIAFSFKIVNKQDTNSDVYNAAYQFVMQILLRPIIVLLAFIIGWSLFSVVYMVINFTMSSFLMYVVGSQIGVVNSLIAAIMSVLAYCILLYYLTKQVFNIMNGLVDKLFSYMGIQTSESSTNQQATSIFESSMMASIIGKETVGGILKNNHMKKKNERIRSRMQEKQQNKK